MKFVVDSSVFVKCYLMEEWHMEASKLVAGSGGLLAPDLIVAEVANVAWKKMQRDEIDWEDAQEMVAGAANGPLSLIPGGETGLLALRIARDLRHPVYDCHYLACSWLYGHPVVTADQRLHRVTRDGPYHDLVRHVGKIA